MSNPILTSISAPLPRITIKFCTQCKWMLRAAYFAQELLSTFSTSLGEVALQPSTGGTFIVEIYYASYEAPLSNDEPIEVLRHVLWDRKTDGGFPETKELKRRVRDIIDPGRDLGHVDGKKKSAPTSASATEQQDQQTTESGDQTQQHEAEAVLQAPMRRPRAISNLQATDTERKFTPMDVDGVEVVNEPDEEASEVKRNPDGSICEDCR